MPREIELTSANCIVFLITGGFVVGGTLEKESVVIEGNETTRTIIARGTEKDKIRFDYLVVNERTLLLKTQTAVAVTDVK